MKCPACNKRAKVKDTREPDLYFTTHRTYECPECLTRFNSTEKIMFDSIPKYIRNKFLESGERS